MLAFRVVETERKRSSLLNPAPDFLPYAAHYMAMLVGQLLLEEQQLNIDEVSHRNLEQLKQRLEQDKAGLLYKAAKQLQTALTQIYGEREVSLQQLSATFRRGDLLEFLPVTTE